jgi:hypothetical protein
MYSSLNVNIAEGSIPIKGVSLEITRKIPTLVLAIAFASQESLWI